MNRFRLALALSALALAGGIASAQAPGTRLRGTVERLEGATLELKAADGREIKVALAPGFSVGGMVAAKVSDIAKGSFIGVGAKAQADGTLLAVQVVIFPEAMRGTGEGRRNSTPRSAPAVPIQRVGRIPIVAPSRPPASEPTTRTP